ncbi:MAG: TAXI family TRAP transporter solute-binding subunit [Vicinamibacterales bacterium]
MRAGAGVRGLAAAAAAIALAGLAACGGGGGGTTTFLSIATGGTGGVYYPYGGAIARLLTQSLPDVQATAEVTGASVDNLKLIQLGKVDLAFTLADTLAEAQAGTGPFQDTGAIGSIRTLAVLYTNYTHIVVRADSGIRQVSDLAGKIVSVGSPGSGTELIADRVLAAAGVDPHTGITRHSLGVSESAGAIKDGKLDAFVWSGGLPTPALQDLAATPGVPIALLPQIDLLPLLQRDYGRDLYRLVPIPGGVYRGIDTDVPVIGATNLLVASSQVDEALAYDIVRVMFERKAELVAAHPEAEDLAVPAGPEASPAPFHPGAVRYYREHGWQ